MISTTTIERSSLVNSNSTKSITLHGGNTPVVSSTETPSQSAQIWEWGVDESLWNPDRTRYAGHLPPPIKVNKHETFAEICQGIRDWMEKDSAMTPAEKEQEKRAMEAEKLADAEELVDAELDESLIDFDC